MIGGESLHDARVRAAIALLSGAASYLAVLHVPMVGDGDTLGSPQLFWAPGSIFGIAVLAPSASGATRRIGIAGASTAIYCSAVLLGNRDELTQLFHGAGVDPVEVTTPRGTARFPDVRTMMEAGLRGWLPVMGVVLPEEQIGRVLEEAERALGGYVTAQGTMEFESPAHIVSGARS